jgi:ABC-type polysaccharide/polyol phosphate transport system ATPase subunit
MTGIKSRKRNVNGVLAIECIGASKSFRRFTERNQTLKQVLARRNRSRYTEHWAVRHLDLEISQGQTVGIIGGNGAGKSTTLKMMAGILEPDEGSVAVRGRVSALLELGAGFHSELTGRENIFLNGAILGLSRRALRDRFDEIVEFSGVADAIDQPVKTYSSGMYARLGFAVAVNVDPDVLLLDEVLTVGDAEFQQKSKEKIADLRSSGRTIVVVSHGLGDLQRMCETVVWIDHGEVKAVGDSNSVINSYLDLVQKNTVVDDAGSLRTGSGEARVFVKSQELTAQQGPITFSFLIKSDVNQSGVALAFAIRQKGQDMYISSARIVLDTVKAGEIEMKYVIPTNTFLAGDYEVVTSLTRVSDSHEFDACSPAFSFQVEGLPGGWEFGLAAMLGSWHS